jgi:hypothetical protein
MRRTCPPNVPVLLLLLFLAALPCLDAPLHASSGSTGDYALPDMDQACHDSSGIIERTLPGFEIVPSTSFAFEGGRMGGQFCLQTLMSASGEFLTDAAFMVTVLGGHPMEELTTPMRTSQAPLEDCWPTRIGFDDINQDEMPDILMLIGCYNGEADAPANDNVLYLSYEDANGDAHYSQTAQMNQVVAGFTDYAQARNAAMQALTGKGADAKAAPAQPTPPPAPEAQAPQTIPVRTCTYETEWGLMTLRFDESVNAVTGTYAYKDGRISGFLQEGDINGVWQQNDGQGSFFFRLTPDGFQGSWNYRGDAGWQGAWNGRLVQCR